MVTAEDGESNHENLSKLKVFIVSSPPLFSPFLPANKQIMVGGSGLVGRSSTSY